jgi:hypothetical protein
MEQDMEAVEIVWPRSEDDQIPLLLPSSVEHWVATINIADFFE